MKRIELLLKFIFSRTKSIQSKLEYLFYCAQPLRQDQNNHMYQFTTIESISEHGFSNVELYKVCRFFFLEYSKTSSLISIWVKKMLFPFQIHLLLVIIFE